MAPRLRTRDAVLAAAAEHDRLGRERFLDTYGYGPATRYLVRIGAGLYDSKAIVGVAYGIEHPSDGRLNCNEFSGGVGVGAAAWQLRKLGFEIVAVAMPI